MIQRKFNIITGIIAIILILLGIFVFRVYDSKLTQLATYVQIIYVVATLGLVYIGALNIKIITNQRNDLVKPVLILREVWIHTLEKNRHDIVYTIQNIGAGLATNIIVKLNTANNKIPVPSNGIYRLAVAGNGELINSIADIVERLNYITDILNVFKKCEDYSILKLLQPAKYSDHSPLDCFPKLTECREEYQNINIIIEYESITGCRYKTESILILESDENIAQYTLVSEHFSDA